MAVQHHVMVSGKCARVIAGVHIQPNVVLPRAYDFRQQCLREFGPAWISLAARTKLIRGVQLAQLHEDSQCSTPRLSGSLEAPRG
jgi:hypothetical protein